MAWCAAAVAFFGFVNWHVIPILPWTHGDFPSFYFAAQQSFGGATTAYDHEALIRLGMASGIGRVHPYVYLPPSLLFFAPLLAMPYRAAQVVFLFGNVAAVVALVFLVFRGVAGLPWSHPAVALGLAYAFMSQPIHMLLLSGQVNLYIACLLCGAWALLRRGRAWELPASLLLSVAIVVKLYPAAFLAFLVAERRWRALGATVGFTAAVLALGTLPLPDGSWRAWYETTGSRAGYGVLPYHLYSPAACWNQSINGLTSRLFRGDGFNEPLLSSSVAARVVPFLLVLALFAATVSACWRSRGSGRQFDFGFSAFLLFSFLAAPFSWEHHLVFAIPSLFLMALECGDGRFRTGGPIPVAVPLLGVAVLLAVPLPWSSPAFPQQESVFRGSLPSLLISAKLFGVLVLWTMQVALLGRARFMDGASKR